MDSEYVLAIESKYISNDPNDNFNDENSDTWIAIYSDTKYAVISCDSIFETLWTKSEIKKGKY